MSMPLRLSLTLFLGLAIAHPPAQAADNTRYVSITGKNTNPCTLALPCRTLQFAINIAPAGGEVQILDPGFYGNNANIKKSLTIAGNGNTVYLGGVLTINKANAVVALRRLVLNGSGAGTVGINIVAPAQVYVEHCLVHGFTQRGISLEIEGPQAALFVTNSIIRNNGTGFLNNGGVIVIGTDTVRLTVDESRLESNFNVGILAINAEATITRTVAAHNSPVGIANVDGRMSVVASTASDSGGNGYLVSSGQMTLEASVARGNQSAGLSVVAGATARISNSVFTNNTVGINNAGTVRTLGNNVVDGNGVNTLGGPVQAVTPF